MERRGGVLRKVILVSNPFTFWLGYVELLLFCGCVVMRLEQVGEDDLTLPAMEEWTAG